MSNVRGLIVACAATITANCATKLVWTPLVEGELFSGFFPQRALCEAERAHARRLVESPEVNDWIQPLRAGAVLPDQSARGFVDA
jgi:hypothetical protein